ncbi:ABC transporter, partial [Bacteroides fragilis]|nr:ABC transporter [Bacteroides fragilis]MCY6323487.1 ABC transporter [Bacteroides fragilis]
MEVLYEIYLSIRQNKIRTFLSGFGISWGILILVVLLGTGKGFQNSVMDIFSIFAQKSMYVYGGATSMKYKNIREGEQLHFDLHFLNRIKKQFPGIKAISPEITGPYSQV